MWLGAVGVLCICVIRWGLFWSVESSDEVLGGLKAGASWQPVCPHVGFFPLFALLCRMVWLGVGLLILLSEPAVGTLFALHVATEVCFWHQCR